MDSLGQHGPFGKKAGVRSDKPPIRGLCRAPDAGEAKRQPEKALGFSEDEDGIDMRVCTCTCIHVFVCIHLHACMHTYAHTYIYTCAYS